jgi:hypothetical protein
MWLVHGVGKVGWRGGAIKTHCACAEESKDAARMQGGGMRQARSGERDMLCVCNGEVRGAMRM